MPTDHPAYVSPEEDVYRTSLALRGPFRRNQVDQNGNVTKNATDDLQLELWRLEKCVEKMEEKHPRKMYPSDDDVLPTGFLELQNDAVLFVHIYRQIYDDYDSSLLEVIDQRDDLTWRHALWLRVILRVYFTTSLDFEDLIKVYLPRFTLDAWTIERQDCVMVRCIIFHLLLLMINVPPELVDVYNHGLDVVVQDIYGAAQQKSAIIEGEESD